MNARSSVAREDFYSLPPSGTTVAACDVAAGAHVTANFFLTSELPTIRQNHIDSMGFVSSEHSSYF